METGTATRYEGVITISLFACDCCGARAPLTAYRDAFVCADCFDWCCQVRSRRLQARTYGAEAAHWRAVHARHLSDAAAIMAAYNNAPPEIRAGWPRGPRLSFTQHAVWKAVWSARCTRLAHSHVGGLP